MALRREDFTKMVYNFFRYTGRRRRTVKHRTIWCISHDFSPLLGVKFTVARREVVLYNSGEIGPYIYFTTQLPRLKSEIDLAVPWYSSTTYVPSTSTRVLKYSSTRTSTSIWPYVMYGHTGMYNTTGTPWPQKIHLSWKR